MGVRSKVLGNGKDEERSFDCESQVRRFSAQDDRFGVVVRSYGIYLRAKRSKSAICEAISSRAASAADRMP